MVNKTVIGSRFDEWFILRVMKNKSPYVSKRSFGIVSTYILLFSTLLRCNISFLTILISIPIWKSGLNKQVKRVAIVNYQELILWIVLDKYMYAHQSSCANTLFTMKDIQNYIKYHLKLKCLILQYFLWFLIYLQLNKF